MVTHRYSRDKCATWAAPLTFSVDTAASIDKCRGVRRGVGGGVGSRIAGLSVGSVRGETGVRLSRVGLLAVSRPRLFSSTPCDGLRGRGEPRTPGCVSSVLPRCPLKSVRRPSLSGLIAPLRTRLPGLVVVDGGCWRGGGESPDGNDRARSGSGSLAMRRERRGSPKNVVGGGWQGDGEFQGVAGLRRCPVGIGRGLLWTGLLALPRPRRHPHGLAAMTDSCRGCDTAPME